MRIHSAPALVTWAIAVVAPARAHGEPLTVERAIALAVERDERAHIADQNVVAADAQVARARAFFFPDVTLTASYTVRGDPGMFQERTGYGARAVASVTLFDGRGFPLYRAARSMRDAAELTDAEARRQVAVEAATAFLTTLGFQAVVEAAQHRVDFARQNVEDTRGRVAAQLVSSNDATRAELELDTANLELLRAQGAVEAARLNLGWLLDTEIDGSLAMPEALIGAAAREGGTAPEHAIDRLDVRAQRKRVEAAHQAALEPLWRWAPIFEVTGETGTTSVEGFTGKRSDWSVTINAVWALWDGGERSADRRARVAEARVAELVSDRQTRLVGLEIDTARSRLRWAHATVTGAKAAVDAARRNVEETRILYKQGLARALELADAGAQLFDVEVALARERFNLGLALVALHAARGLGPLGERGEPGEGGQRP